MIHTLWEDLSFGLYLAGSTIFVLLCIVGWWWLEPQVQRLRNRFRPLCLACRTGRLLECNLGFSDAKEYQYFRCNGCESRFKRSIREGRWVNLPPNAADKRELDALFERPTSLMTRAKKIEFADPLGSWFGSVQVGLPGEEWPEYEGVPMLPLCQIRCEEISTLPSMLQNLALICVFTAFVGEEAVSTEGERWVVRTYESLEGLIPITYPGAAAGIRAYPIAWKAELDTPPDRFSLPETLWMDFEAYSLDQSHWMREKFHGSKVGGYRTGNSHNPQVPQPQANFVFQTEIQGDFPWVRGPGGTLFFFYDDETSGNRWTLAWQSSSIKEGKRWKDIRMGCEVEGMQLYIETPEGDGVVGRLGMCYGTRTGSVLSLRDLRGLVHITTADMALQFVRLRTYGIVYDFEVNESEVLTKTEDACRPPWYLVGDWRHTLFGPMISWEVIPEAADRTVFDPETFQKLGFEAVRVETMDGGFRVLRWTYRYAPWQQEEETGNKYRNGTYQKIAETVAADGSYIRTVLEQRPAPERELLRPTGGAGETDPDELLRPPP